MNYLEAWILAIVQGLTEFLPISSSAHLILVPAFLGWPDQGLAFDVAVHLGSLIAVCTYFRHEILAVSDAWLRSLVDRDAAGPESRFGWFIILATLPGGIAGLLLHDFIDEHLRSPLVIAASTAFFGVLLWLADRHGGRGKDEHAMQWQTALLIGIAQAIALIPGTSRSGITITAGLALGLSRQAAARFSFMLAIPIITAAAGLEIVNLVELKEPVDWGLILFATAVSCLSAYLCIRIFLRLLEKVSMLPFAIYRLLLAAIIFVMFV